MHDIQYMLNRKILNLVQEHISKWTNTGSNVVFISISHIDKLKLVPKYIELDSLFFMQTLVSSWILDLVAFCYLH